MVDIATISTVLTSLKTATDIAKFLKDSDISLERAEAKLQLAEIVSSLADAKIEIAQIQEVILEKDQKIKELQVKIDELTSGENCPLCKDGRLKTTASRPHPHLGIVGVQERTVTCQNPNCHHSEKRLDDPRKANN